MRSPIRIALFIAAAAIVFGISSSFAAPAVKWAAINLTDTTMIAGKFVSGPVIFVHDDARMARGEPCTSVHRHEPGKGLGEELVAFHCTPRWGKAPDKFTKAVTTRPDAPPVMTEYQFAGDEEAHLIPVK
jgi:hypothetical protein